MLQNKTKFSEQSVKVRRQLALDHPPPVKKIDAYSSTNNNDIFKAKNN